MSSLIAIAREFVSYYVNNNKEHIEDIQDDVAFNDAFLFSFVAYVENPTNGYTELMYSKFNENIKSYYVRYCNKYIKDNYGYECCVKYNVSKVKLMLHIAQTVASENYELIENLLNN